MYTSVNIPIGFGLEAFWSRKTSFYLDLGYRVTDDWTDYSAQKNTLPDGYAVAKAGINFYFGMSDSDDEDMDGLTNGEEKKLKTDRPRTLRTRQGGP